MPFDVFIESPPGATPTEVAQLAQGISARYGVPSERVVALLGRGRFRVKAHVDQPTAAQFVAELAGLGATCTVLQSSAPALPRPPVAIAAIKVAKRAVSVPASHASAARIPPPLPADGSATATDIEGLLERIKAETGQFALATLDGASADVPVFGDLFAEEPASNVGPRDPFAPPVEEGQVFLVTEDLPRRNQ